MSIARSLAGSFLVSLDLAKSSLSTMRDYFCTDVVDTLTLYRDYPEMNEPALHSSTRSKSGHLAILVMFSLISEYQYGLI